MPAPRPINILCFGDSLTSGYCSFGLNSHPYSIRLEDRLFDALPGVRIEVFTNGVPGDVVQNQPFKKRLDAELRKRPYDWVIMLGGTNDIGTARSAQDTFEALKECWGKVLIKGSKLLALTIPECAVQMPWLDESRKELNEMILSHQEPKFHTFDLKTHIPYHSLTEDEKADRWDDGLHLTPAGYDWMGSSIADAFVPLLERDQQLYQKVKPTSRHSEDTSVDERFSEEEDGSSKDIRAGYVMVRKKDLD